MKNENENKNENKSENKSENNNDKETIEKQTFLKIKNLLLKPCTSVERISFSVNNYKDVINLWINYKKNELTIKDYTIKNIFIFHKNLFDHVIIYHSQNMETSLLMCRISGKYKNIIIQNDEIKNIEFFNKFKPNFVATYC